MLDVLALLHLGQGDAFADVPQPFGLRQVFCDHGIGHATCFKRGFEQGFKLSPGVAFAFAVGVFKQHAPRRFLPQGHAQLGVVFVNQA